MKAKISRGGGFRGAVSYVLDKGAAENVGGNMSGRTVSELTSEFGITKKLRPDCKNPVWHCSLALPEGDRLSAKKWDELSADFMLEMGMDPANYLYDVQRHSDTDHDHIHIVASRIGLDGTLWHGQKDVFLAMKATEKLEQRHHLTLTPGFDPEHKKERKSLTSQEINMGVRAEIKPPRLAAQEAIDTVLQIEGVISAPEFITRLAAFGVRAVPNIASTGAMNGFSFEVEGVAGVAFTGSKLGDSYKWAQLQKRGIEYVKDRDFEELADTRRRAGERAAAQRDDGQDRTTPGSDSGPGQELGAVAAIASADSRASHSGPGATAAAASELVASAIAVRADESAANRVDASELVADIEPVRARESVSEISTFRDDARDRIEQRGSEQSSSPGAGTGSGADAQPLGRADESAGYDAEKSQDSDGFFGAESPGAGRNAGKNEGGSGGNIETVGATGRAGAKVQTEKMARAGEVVGRGHSGGVDGGGWSSRFKQLSAATAKRRRDAEAAEAAGAGGVGSQNVGASHAKRARVNQSDRRAAREIDPTLYLQSRGFEVKKDGLKHLSVRAGGDEVYRCTQKEDGRWLWCDFIGNAGGDNISLVKEIQPNISFQDSVYALAGGSGEQMQQVFAPRIQPAVPLVVPMATREDERAGRRYLTEHRGISLQTVQHAEKAGFVQYVKDAVLFCGLRAKQVMSATRRAILPNDEVQKRDLRGSNKSFAAVLPGNKKVWIVEGGTDALAVQELALRRGKDVPTVIVSGGVGVRSWLENSAIQQILKSAETITVACEREKSADVQRRTDADRAKQIERIEQLTGHQVKRWQPGQGIKDVAEQNLIELDGQEAEAPAPAHPAPRM